MNSYREIYNMRGLSVIREHCINCLVFETRCIVVNIKSTGAIKYILSRYTYRYHSLHQLYSTRLCSI